MRRDVGGARRKSGRRRWTGSPSPASTTGSRRSYSAGMSIKKTISIIEPLISLCPWDVV